MLNDHFYQMNVIKKKQMSKWKIDTTKVLNHHFERAEMDAKYPGLIDKMKAKYTKLSDFKYDTTKD